MQLPPKRHLELCDSQESQAWGASSPVVQRLLNHVQRLDLPYGSEASFKMTKKRLLKDRILIGYSTEVLPARELCGIALDLGMPASCQQILKAQLHQANAVLFGVEPREEGSICKLYLEFWDQVRAQVRLEGPTLARLLHLGLKWEVAHPNRHELARYFCRPMINPRDVLRCMAKLYPIAPQPSTLEDALSIVRQGIKRAPQASLLYMEAQEEGNPRHSFDVNLYKTGLRVGDVQAEIKSAATHLGLSIADLLITLNPLRDCLLGHLAGGTDRYGNEFLSLYAELRSNLT